MSFLDRMWQNHRTTTIIIGVILFPIAIAVIGLKIYMAMQVKGAHKDMEKAKEKDAVLAQQQNDLQKQADASLSNANQAAQRREDRANESVDLDWNKKRDD